MKCPSPKKHPPLRPHHPLPIYHHPTAFPNMSPPHTPQRQDDDEHAPDEGSSISHRFLLPDFEDTEDLEKYRLGGFHPVHLRDTYHGGRYRVVHKLGAGWA